MATITKQTIRVDLTPGRVYPVLHVSQGDVGLEALEFYVYQNGQPFTIPSEVTAINIDGMTPAGVFSYPCTWTGNVVTAGLTATMTAERGIDICELALYDATNNKIGTCNFVIAVEESPFTNAHVSTSDMATIMAAASSAQQYELLSKSWAVGDTGIRTGENTNNSEYWAEISESWAVGDTGKRTGENINNSEYWSTISHQYANTISFKTYDTVAQMKADTGLLDGGVCLTLGYYVANDEGGALYRIETSAPAGHYETLSNGLYAELIDYNVLTPEIFGAYGDGTHDDTVALQAAVTRGFNDKKAVYLSKKYLVTSPIVVKGVSKTYENKGSELIGNNYAHIIAGTTLTNLIETSPETDTRAYGITIKGLILDGANQTTNGFYSGYAISESLFENVTINRCTNGLHFNGNSYLNTFRSVRAYFCTAYGFLFENGHNTSLVFEKCYVDQCANAYKINGQYCTMLSCCADGITGTVFELDSFKGALIGCGSESSGFTCMFKIGTDTNVSIVGGMFFGNETLSGYYISVAGGSGMSMYNAVINWGTFASSAGSLCEVGFSGHLTLKDVSVYKSFNGANNLHATSYFYNNTAIFTSTETVTVDSIGIAPISISASKYAILSAFTTRSGWIVLPYASSASQYNVKILDRGNTSFTPSISDRTFTITFTYIQKDII